MLWTPLVVQLMLVLINFTAADIVDADYAQFRISKTSKEEYSKYLKIGACSGIYFDEHNETSLNNYKEWEMKTFLNSLRTVLTYELSESEINALKSKPNMNPVLNARPPPGYDSVVALHDTDEVFGSGYFLSAILRDN